MKRFTNENTHYFSVTAFFLFDDEWKTKEDMKEISFNIWTQHLHDKTKEDMKEISFWLMLLAYEKIGLKIQHENTKQLREKKCFGTQDTSQTLIPKHQYDESIILRTAIQKMHVGLNRRTAPL